MKYPWASNNSKAKEKEKFGYFQAEEELIKKIKENVGINGCRHPATFLVEAADDIAYLTADIEDAVKKGVFDWETEYQKMKTEFEKKYPNLFEKLETYRKEALNNQDTDKNLIDVQNFKVRVQGIVFGEVVGAFN
ncbi:hypothetical protein [Neobacillus sp. PS3-40]|uniref:hypothetical protein n=1 Tax=Neobacillus sp. PS3-40 TaxID=3070679 RepID=UPI0027E0BD26|nr:hypothetical protein [Neobacillus sp. PS3-40]WML46146.1 hypothetical protein RCG20_09755 [Neobacillus sp. PS3-40]